MPVTPWVQLDTAAVPGGDTLRLLRRRDEFSIMVGTTELMNSRRGGSEQELARLTCTRLAGVRGARVLIGGLGMGFTLRSALELVAADAEVVVAELVPGVVAWARGLLAGVFGGMLDDGRVSIREEDVGKTIAAANGVYDAILLDVDNGPDGLSRSANDRLYSAAGIVAARKALRPSGVLAVWSSGPDDAFARRLRSAGLAVEEVEVRSGGGKRGPQHVIWLATRHGRG